MESGYRGSVGFDLKPVCNRYEAFISELDRLRIYIACRTYQKRYGYSYEDSLKFTRRELCGMFAKPYRFIENGSVEDEKCGLQSDLTMYDRSRWKLWDIRKAELLEKVTVLFPPLDYGQSTQKYEKYMAGWRKIRNTLSNDYFSQLIVQERENVLRYIEANNDIILYGTGRDCDAILQHVDERRKAAFLFCDQKAEQDAYIYMGKNVISPSDLNADYMGYKILITSSQYYQLIQYELECRGIDADRIYCNKVQFWDEK
jgi:hypothetical protein